MFGGEGASIRGGSDSIESQATRSLPVLFMPGAVVPVEMAFGPVLGSIKDEVQPVLKELEVYAGEVPPPGYRMEMEVEAIGEAADRAGMESFHLVGYSAGGAFALAFTARYPERLRSLALVEPAWIGSQNWTPDEEVYWSEMDRAMVSPPEKRIEAFYRVNAGMGQPPPELPTPLPPWMAIRAGGIEAITRAFKSYNLSPKRFRHFLKPVYLAIGGLSQPAEKRKADRLMELFPDIQLEVYEGRYHLDPPHRAEPDRFARALHELWGRAEGQAAINVS